MANCKQDEEMSMEDILSSIRKYVSDEKRVEPYGNEENSEKSEQYQQNYPNEADNTSAENSDDDVIVLEQGDVVDQSVRSGRVAEENIVLGNSPSGIDYNNINTEETTINSYKSTDKSGESPFNKLAEALKTYGSRKKSTELNLKMSMEQFFRTVIETTFKNGWMLTLRGLLMK